ncbi:MAG: thymidine phosphorylase [Bacillota bacterium]|nr:thymidine phosphorylase [Bacillota bacterium]
MTPHMYDIIRTKRDGGRLDDGTIHSVIAAYVTDRIPDYQMAALLMAIWFRGLDDAELAALTRALIDSGERIDLSSIPGTTVDKHSTGGVGDKTTLVVAPVVAACGVPVAKLSGRGLGHTGGTIDKLEAIPGFSCDLSGTAFLRQVETIGIAVAGQTADIAPGDKKLYALRDVTATVDSLPLIAASIMSKKLAAGSDAIQLDVKTGSGAFMKSLDDAIRLAETMVAIGTRAGRPTAALVTDMDTPLGHDIGNSLEVAEAIRCLRGGGPCDLETVSLELAAGMLELAGHGEHSACLAEAHEALRDGRALAKLGDLILAQGGDPAVVDDPGLLPAAPARHEVTAGRSGYLAGMDAEGIGTASVLLGAGRRRLGDRIEPGAGIRLLLKTGAKVRRGDTLAVLCAEDGADFAEAEKRFLSALRWSDSPPPTRPLIQARVTATETRRFT